MAHALRNGVIAGAVGTVALYTVTYLDMAVRGRAASSLPERTAGELARRAGVDLGEREVAEHREEGLGPLLGLLTGVGTGVGYGLFRRMAPRVPAALAAVGVGAAAAVAGNAPMTALGLTDPREWGLQGWLSDLIPHLAYGAATVAAYEAIDS